MNRTRNLQVVKAIVLLTHSNRFPRAQSLYETVIGKKD